MIKSYEVFVSKSYDKTLIVNAVSPADARRITCEAYEAGEFSMDDINPEFDVIDVSPATDICYEVRCAECEEDETHDDEDCDIIFECERCPDRNWCDNETKLRT